MPNQLQDELVRRAMARDAQAQIGPLDPRTQPTYPDREDPFSSPDLLHKALDTVVDPGNWGSGGGGSVEAVAAGGPANIPRLKALGQELLTRLKSEGVAQTMLGQPVPILEPNSWWEKLRGPEHWSKVAGYKPNVPLNKETMTALEFAQNKYPRLFGHLATVTDIDGILRLQDAATGGTTSGYSAPAFPHTYPSDPLAKISSLGLNPQVANANTVGHELLHTADRLTMPGMDQAYQHATTKLPPVEVGGRLRSPYEVSSYEIRARNAGESFSNKMEKEGLLNRVQLNPNIEDMLKERELGRTVPITYDGKP